MGKTADYTRKAIDDYRNKFDFINLKFPKGTKDKIKALGISNNDLVEECLNFIAGVEESANDLYYNCSTRQNIIQDAQSDDISHIMGRVVKSIDNGITSLTEPQNASGAAITETEVNSIPDGRDKWRNVQSVEELQAMLEAKREDEKRRLQEQKQAKADELERERQENLSTMMMAIDKAMNAQKQREKFDEEELESMEDDGDDFSKYSVENIKDVLRENGYFREHVASHVYKDAMIEKYGASNYNLFQKCLREVEEEEKESKRQETIARAITESNQ